MSNRSGRCLLVAGLATLVAAPPAAAQSAKEILETAVERYEARMEGVDDYTVVQDAMGMELTQYYVKRTVEGRTVFEEQGSYGDAEADTDIGQFYDEFAKFADRAESAGTESVDGRECHVVRVNDFSGIDFGDEDDEMEESFDPKEGTFYLDTDDYVLRKMVLDGERVTDGETVPVTMELLLQDYRDVEGMLYPFETQMSISGEAAGMSQEEIEEARRSLEELRAQMEEMPEQQRRMMESMLGSQMEQLESIVNSGMMEFTISVKELRVNSGPPQ